MELAVDSIVGFCPKRSDFGRFYEERATLGDIDRNMFRRQDHCCRHADTMTYAPSTITSKANKSMNAFRQVIAILRDDAACFLEPPHYCSPKREAAGQLAAGSHRP